MLPNRIATYLLAALGVVAALAPVAANLDWSSTAGVIAGAGVIAAAGVTWLRGWQHYEERTALEPLIAEQIAQGPPEGAAGFGEHGEPQDPGARKSFTQAGKKR